MAAHARLGARLEGLGAKRDGGELGTSGRLVVQIVRLRACIFFYRGYRVRVYVCSCDKVTRLGPSEDCTCTSALLGWPRNNAGLDLFFTYFGLFGYYGYSRGKTELP